MGRVSVAYACAMPAPHTLDSVMTGVSRPAQKPRSAGGAISALYVGTKFSMYPTAMYANTRPTVNTTQSLDVSWTRR